MDVAVLPIPEYGLSVGQAYDWKTLRSYLKSMDFLRKAGKGWELVHPLTGEVTPFKKQDDLKDVIFSDPEYGQELKSALIAAMMDTDEVIAV